MNFVAFQTLNVRLHPKRFVPYNAILVFGLIMTIFAEFTGLTRAVAISNFASYC
ncbi:MAG: hypothetical protein ACXVHW_09830 [Methanobacterium sp.]